MLPSVRLRTAALLLLIFTSALLLSPKWFAAIGVWLHYPALLYLLRTRGWRGWGLGYLTATAATVVAQYEVFPMPLPALITFMLIANLIGLLPFVIDRLAHRRFGFLGGTLVYPVVATLLDVFFSYGPQGTWGNAAYTQYFFSPLIQLASVTGIFGINFLYYWFAATLVGYVQYRPAVRRLVPYTVIAAGVLLYGSLRLLGPASPIGERTPVAAVNIETMEVNQAMYAAAFGRRVALPEGLSMSSPALAELNRGLPAFMAAPEDTRFASVYRTIDSLEAAYFSHSAAAVARGARIVSWSEGAMLTVQSREALHLERAARFADAHDCYLFYPLVTFHADKVGRADQFMENKVFTFGPNGTLLNTYFKNVPIMGVEPSFPGDGTVPVIPTAYGRLSPLICYDADHPTLVAQTSDTRADLLVVPTGDWDAIAPFHTYMAAVRCIENGTSMLKATNHGQSALIDTRGRLVAQARLGGSDQANVLLGALPLRSVTTPYVTTAPLFVGGLLLLMALGVCGLILRGVRRIGRLRTLHV